MDQRHPGHGPVCRGGVPGAPAHQRPHDPGRLPAPGGRGGGGAAGQRRAGPLPRGQQPGHQPGHRGHRRYPGGGADAAGRRRRRADRGPLPAAERAAPHGHAGRSPGDAGAGRHHGQHGERGHGPDHAAGRRQPARRQPDRGRLRAVRLLPGLHRRLHRRARPVPGPLPADRGRLRAHGRLAGWRPAGRAGGAHPAVPARPPARRAAARARRDRPVGSSWRREG